MKTYVFICFTSKITTALLFCSARLPCYHQIRIYILVTKIVLSFNAINKLLPASLLIAGISAMSVITWAYRPFDLANPQDWHQDRILIGAKSGNAQAEHLAGIGYQNHMFGFPTDEKQSLYWYIKAGNSGVAEGYFNAAMIVKAKNPELYIRLLRNAAVKGLAPAELQYGKELLASPENRPAGLKWIALAAQHGDKKAAYDLGTLYGEGSLLKKDEKKSAFWLSKAPNGDLSLQ